MAPIPRLDDRPARMRRARGLPAPGMTPTLPRPLADRVQGSKVHNLKELRPGSAGSSEVRILFCFDPERQAVLLVAGDKSGQWRDWYKRAIPLAEERYARWLVGGYAEERT